MNDNQNNIMNDFNPIPSTNANINNNIESNAIPGANLSPINNQTPIQVIEPVLNQNVVANNTQQNLNTVSEINNNLVNQNNNVLTPLIDNNVIPVMPNSIIPENINAINNQNSNSTPELKKETSSPFDIGLNNQTIQPNLNNEVIPPVTSNVSPQPINNLSDNSPITTQQITNNNSSNDNIVSVGKYLGHIVLFSIPVVGLIMLLVKAFGDKNDINISNLAKAQLLLSLIIIVIFFIITIFFSSLLIGIVGI